MFKYDLADGIPGMNVIKAAGRKESDDGRGDEDQEQDGDQDDDDDRGGTRVKEGGLRGTPRGGDQEYPSFDEEEAVRQYHRAEEIYDVGLKTLPPQDHDEIYIAGMKAIAARRSYGGSGGRASGYSAGGRSSSGRFGDRDRVVGKFRSAPPCKCKGRHPDLRMCPTYQTRQDKKFDPDASEKKGGKCDFLFFGKSDHKCWSRRYNRKHHQDQLDWANKNPASKKRTTSADGRKRTSTPRGTRKPFTRSRSQSPRGRGRGGRFPASAGARCAR